MIGRKMNLIVACDGKMGIGRENDLPWKLTKEFKYFTQNTTRTNDKSLINAVIMGRKCWDSIPAKFRPLKNRLNVVISRTMEQPAIDNVLVYNDFDKAIHDLLGDTFKDKVETVWNIGGSDVYRMGLSSPHLNNIYMTHINGDFNCDVIFPKMEWAKFEEIHLDNTPAGIHNENHINYEFKVYRKKIDQ